MKAKKHTGEKISTILDLEIIEIMDIIANNIGDEETAILIKESLMEAKRKLIENLKKDWVIENDSNRRST